MRAAKITSIYICCWSLRDPLCETQVLAYLRALARTGLRFALITFEQDSLALHGDAKIRAHRTLETDGIQWYPLPYRRGRPMVGRSIDSARGILLGTYIARRHGADVVHARSTVPAAVGIGIAALCRLPLLYDADCELSREYVDAGHWREDGASYKLTSRLERLARARSASTVVLTEYMRGVFLAEGERAPITVIPCCVDVDQFRFDPVARDQRRKELGIANERLFIYVGKVGASSWYLVEETFAFFRSASTTLGGARLLILSPSPPALFHAIAQRQGVAKDAYDIRRVPHNEVNGWLSAADAGIALIAPFESKKGCSPVKVGEYLAVGLPVVITDHIGDYSLLIRNERLGTVLEEHTVEAYERGTRDLSELWDEGDRLRARCRKIAEEAVSLGGVGVARYIDVYTRLRRGEVTPDGTDRQSEAS